MSFFWFTHRQKHTKFASFILLDNTVCTATTISNVIVPMRTEEMKILIRDATTRFIYRRGTIERELYGKHRGERSDRQRWSRIEKTSEHCGTKTIERGVVMEHILYIVAKTKTEPKHESWG